MRIFVLILLIILLSNATDKPKTKNDFSLKDEMNQSVIDGFFNGDTTGKDISQFYFMK